MADKKPGHKGWEEVRRNQIAIFRVGALLFLSLLVILFIIIIWPVRVSLEKGETSEFHARADLLEYSARAFFDQSKQIALQVPSRTMIRKILVEYVKGGISLDSLVDFTRPKLKDAVLASTGLLGVLRYSPDKIPLTGVKLAPPDPSCLFLNDEQPVILLSEYRIGSILALLISVPIVDPEYGLAGYDLAAISLAPLSETLARGIAENQDMNVVLAVQDGVNLNTVLGGESSLAESLSARDVTDCEMPGTYVDMIFSSETAAYESRVYCLSPGWFIIVGEETSVLHGDTRKQVLLFILLILAVGIGAFLFYLLGFRLLSRKTLTETGELERIVDERTGQLNLLLKEIHHRVKNDVQMIQAFVSLQRSAVTSPGAEEAFRRVEQFVVSVQRIYDSLHKSGANSTVNVKEYLTGLLNSEHYTFSNHLRLENDIEDLLLSQQTALYLGVITNELIINSMKYAKGEVQEEVFIRIFLGHIETGEILFSVENSGDPFPQEVVEEGSYGFGLSLAESLANHLEARFSITNDPRPAVQILFKA